MYTEHWSAREFCRLTTGHDQVWPYDVPDSCPACGQEFKLSDSLTVAYPDGDDDVLVYHSTCYDSLSKTDD